jgi:hypothetical protein
VTKKRSQNIHEHNTHCATCASHIDALESRLNTLEKRLEQLAPRPHAEKRTGVEAALRDRERTHLSDREIARQCGVTHGFVLKMRKVLKLPRDPAAPRLVTRGGTTYPMRIGQINTARKK